MTEPVFAAIFDEGIFPAADSAPQEISAADLATVFAGETNKQRTGGLGSLPHGPRFDGDTSKLPPDVCWTLQELVAAPHLREESKKHWSVLLQYEVVIRSRLCELGLILEINREHGYAFTRQSDDASPHARTLLRARTLSLAASALALYLYNQYVISPDDPVVETADMIDHMLGYKAADDTDEAGFQRKALAAIRSLEEASVIKPVPGTSRYIIYGIITAILSAERVEALDARYKAIAAGAASPDPDPHRLVIGPGPGAGGNADPLPAADGEDDYA